MKITPAYFPSQNILCNTKTYLFYVTFRQLFFKTLVCLQSYHITKEADHTPHLWSASFVDKISPKILSFLSSSISQIKNTNFFRDAILSFYFASYNSLMSFSPALKHSPHFSAMHCVPIGQILTISLSFSSRSEYCN